MSRAFLSQIIGCSVMTSMARNCEIRISDSKNSGMTLRLELGLQRRSEKHDCKCFAAALVYSSEKFRVFTRRQLLFRREFSWNLGVRKPAPVMRLMSLLERHRVLEDIRLSRLYALWCDSRVLDDNILVPEQAEDPFQFHTRRVDVGRFVLKLYFCLGTRAVNDLKAVSAVGEAHPVYSGVLVEALQLLRFDPLGERVSHAADGIEGVV